MFFIARFILVWMTWFILADKKRWREIIPTCFLAGLIAATTDNLMGYYKLWSYQATGFPSAIIRIFDDVGIYIVVAYLFIQYLPRKRANKTLITYWIIWTSIVIFIEFIHIITGHMTYHGWWNIGHSYIADWILFWIFYKFYKAHSNKEG